MKSKIVATLFTSVLLESIVPNNSAAVSVEEDSKVCGSQLSHVLSENCRGDYPEKRSSPPRKTTLHCGGGRCITVATEMPPFGNNEPSYGGDYDIVISEYDVLGSANEMKQLGETKTKRNTPIEEYYKQAILRNDFGIADNCCKKKCSAEKLQIYCELFNFLQQGHHRLQSSFNERFERLRSLLL